MGCFYLGKKVSRTAWLQCASCGCVRNSTKGKDTISAIINAVLRYEHATQISLVLAMASISFDMIEVLEHLA
jgi:hypothetical protein